MSSPLDELYAQLDHLENQVAKLMPQVGAEDPHRLRVSRLLMAVQREHPGAYVKINDIACYLTEREEYRATHRVVTTLRAQQAAQTVKVFFGQTQHTLVRLTLDGDGPDAVEIAERVRQLLAPLNHDIEIRPSRMVENSFTELSVRHLGRDVPVWLHTHPYVVTVDRNEIGDA